MVVVSYDYFKEVKTQERREDKYEEYKAKKDAESAELKPSTIVPVSNGFSVNTRFGLFRIGAGNTKVKFPTINLEAGLTCSSQKHCKFAFQNKRDGKSKARLCYAQKLEGSRPAMFNSKIYQAEVCERISQQASLKEMRQLAKDIVLVLGFLPGNDYVRFSEVGDIGPKVSRLAKVILKAISASGRKPYLYTKRPAAERAALKKAGAVVLLSEKDFVVVKSEEEAKDKGLPVCPGVCGGPNGCFRCPQGEQSAVIGH